MKKRAFTLMELIIVLIIIGILSTLGIAYFDPMKENALDNEARANLRLIIAAERTRRMEAGAFYASASPHETNINTNLRLLLPAQANRNWNYVTTVIASVPQQACAQATRNGAGARTWCYRSGTVASPQTDPVRNTCAASCP